MKKLSIVSVLILLLAFTSCKNNKETDVETSNLEATEMKASEIEKAEKKIVVAMHSSSNSNVQGEVVFTENNGFVKMQGEFSGLNPEGIHAIHLHEKADCSAADGSSAGGHWNPTDEKHGKWDAADGFHLGDIGNLKVDKNGNASITFETDEWCIDCADDRKNIIGKGIIVHKDKDDFTSQPTGNAGDRISCGEINL
ncbi:MAG TPA: superoxide dismutase family protein [Flavobacteriaceae bacterium]|nr:superoxide dismutase family protein [Flavobacteriaceae bacterium]